jgi:hypothetical protein
MRTRILIALMAMTFTAFAAGADGACVNKFTRRADGARHVITFLTGKMTFHDAQVLAAAIRDGKSAPLEWVDGSGKSIAKQFGELKVIRPMPVSCENNSSGVIMIAVFPSAQPPVKKMIVKMDASNTIAFDEQAE